MFNKTEVVADSDDKIVIIDADIDEFVSICNSLKSNGTHDALTKNKLSDETIRSMINRGAIPLISRGLNTQHVFEKYNVDCEFISVVLTSVDALMQTLGKSFDDT